MPATISIPNGNQRVGSTVYGPLTLANADSVIRVDLDRTVTGGLNATPTAHVRALFEQQIPGDMTWWEISSCTFDGGIRTDPETGQLNTDYLDVTLIAPGSAGRAVRCTLTVSGTTVRLAGTVTVT